MNDFTKDELDWLFWEVESCLKYEEDDLPFKIRDKLKSMIDNYCEHEIHPERPYECWFCQKEMDGEE